MINDFLRFHRIPFPSSLVCILSTSESGSQPCVICSVPHKQFRLVSTCTDLAASTCTNAGAHMVTVHCTSAARDRCLSSSSTMGHAKYNTALQGACVSATLQYQGPFTPPYHRVKPSIILSIQCHCCTVYHHVHVFITACSARLVQQGYFETLFLRDVMPLNCVCHSEVLFSWPL